MGFANTGGVFTLNTDQPLSSAPGLVTYMILGPNSQLVPGQNSTADQTPAQAIGKKDDAAVVTVGTTASVIAMLKGLIGTQGSRQVFSSAIQPTVVVNATAADKSLPKVTITLQTGRTIDRVTAAFAWRKQVESSGSANAVNVAQKIQIRIDTPGCWVDAITLADNSLATAASATEGGMMILGEINIKSDVAATDGYDFQWENADVDGVSLTFHDVQTYLIIDYD